MKNDNMQPKPETSDEQESGSALRDAACSASSELIENLWEWGEYFRENQHGATLTILRARKMISDQSSRIEALEEVLNRLFHYTDCTSGQMEIIEEVSPQNVEVRDRSGSGAPPQNQTP
jgi:hypothetical protein